MHQLTTADRVWNRACQGGGETPRVGDTALAALLVFHGAAMNGGVLHGVECLSTEELVASSAGYRFFGFAPVAELIARASNVLKIGEELEGHERKLDHEYAALIPDDSTLVKRFERHFQANAPDFSPIQ